MAGNILKKQTSIFGKLCGIALEICGFAIVAAGALSLNAQTTPKPMIGGSSAAAHMEQERQRLAAGQRQQKMLEDADRLLEMAQQLKISVDKSNKDQLSVEVVREAERIEKLARQVKDNMRQ